MSQFEIAFAFLQQCQSLRLGKSSAAGSLELLRKRRKTSRSRLETPIGETSRAPLPAKKRIDPTSPNSTETIESFCSELQPAVSIEKSVLVTSRFA